MKAIQLFILLIFSSVLTAQSFSGTTSQTNVLKTTDGFVIPVVDTFDLVAQGNAEEDVMVYLTKNLRNYSVSTTAKNYATGFYYWDNIITDWVAVDRTEIALETNTAQPATEVVRVVHNNQKEIKYIKEEIADLKIARLQSMIGS